MEITNHRLNVTFVYLYIVDIPYDLFSELYFKITVIKKKKPGTIKEIKTLN